MVRPLRKGDTTGTQVSNLKVVQNGEELDYDLLPLATTSTKGAMSDTQFDKLDGIEEGADVTDSQSVKNAGGILDSDFGDVVGAMRRVSTGFYTIVKDNLEALVAPTANDDTGDGYSEGSLWVDTVANKVYFCADATLAGAVWKEAGGAGGGGISDGSTLSTGLTFPNTGLHILDTNASHDLILAPGSDMTADRTLTVTTGDADRTLTMTASTSLGGGTHSGTNTGDQTITLQGPVTGTGTGTFTTTITDAAVTNAKLANMATSTIKGRVAAGDGAPTDLSGTQATGLLDAFTGATGIANGVKGLVPQPLIADIAKFLKADGTWSAVPGGGDALTSSNLDQFADVSQTAGQSLSITSSTTLSGGTHSGSNTGDQTITLTGDVTGTGTGSFAATIAADAVTNAKLADVAGYTVKAKTTTGTGNLDDVALGANDLLGRIATGDVQGITLADLTEDTTPAAGDFLLGWETGGAMRKFDVGDLPAGTPADNSITNAKLADVSTATIKGRTTAGTGDPEDLTGAQATALLSEFVADGGTGSGVKGLVPAPTAGADSKYLRGDKTWQTISGGGDAQTSANLDQFADVTQTSGKTLSITENTTLSGGTHSGSNTGDQTITLTGDVTGTGTGSFAATIAADAVTNAKMANMTAQSIKANATGSAENPTDLVVAEQRIVGRKTGGNVAALTAAEVLTLTGAEATANKNVASGYAGLDARAMVAVDNMRPREWDRHRFSIQSTMALPGYRQVGFETPLSIAGKLSTVVDANGVWTRHTTANSYANEGAGVEGPHMRYVQAQWYGDWTTRIRIPSDLTNCQVWVGLQSRGILAATAPAGLSVAAFRYINGTDTKWTTYTCDGTATTEVKTSNFSASVVADTIYELRVSIRSGKVEFWLDGTKCTTDHTANLPVGDTWLAPLVMLTTAVQSARSLDISRATMEHL